MSSGHSQTPTIGLGRLIGESMFHVPVHQRDYAWTETEINKLFEDIELSMHRNDDIYFLGLMVFQASDRNTMTVLDGQQRLATTFIILSAVRNWLHQYSEFRTQAGKIEDRLIAHSELGEDDLSPRMTLNSANNDAFDRFVVKSVGMVDVNRALALMKKQDRSRRLLEAVVQIRAKIDEIAKVHANTSEAAKRLYSFVTFITKTVSIVRFVVDSDDAAYTIFETLNDRGLELSPLDLVKNYLFSRAVVRSKEVQLNTRVRDLEGRWAEMMAILADSKADAFLKVFWTSRHGLVQGTNLYGEFKKKYKEPGSALQVSIDMRAAAERYAALENPEDIIWSGYTEKSKETIRSLKILGAKLAHPMIMAAMARFEQPEMEKLLRLIEIIIVRFQLIGSGRPGRLESTCARLASMIDRKEVNLTAQASTEFREIYPADPDFERDFQTAKNIENRKCQYLLNRLERQARSKISSKSDALQPGSLTIEHVLPKKPGAAWKSVIEADPEIIEECTLRLGNICLLPQSDNKALGSKGFPDKRTVLGESDLLTTASIGNLSNWDRSAIESRQSALATLAVAEWRFQ